MPSRIVIFVHCINTNPVVNRSIDGCQIVDDNIVSFTKTNDQLMTIYLSSLVRAITAFHDLIDNKIQNRQQQEEQEKSKEPAKNKSEKDDKKVNGAVNGESDKEKKPTDEKKETPKKS